MAIGPAREEDSTGSCVAASRTSSGGGADAVGATGCEPAATVKVNSPESGCPSAAVTRHATA